MIKLQYDFNREAAKNHYYQQVKLINMNILQVHKYYHFIKVELEKTRKKLFFAVEKETKITKDQERKQLDALAVPKT